MTTHASESVGVSTRSLMIDDIAAVWSASQACPKPNPGFEVWGEAEDGCGAIDLVCELVPDIVLLDYLLHDLDKTVQSENLDYDRN